MLLTEPPGHAPGTAGYRRLVGAVWAAGVGSFTLLYAPQALLPLISEDLRVRPSTAALVVSVATGTLALALIPMSALAERVGRTRLMTVALTAAALLGLVAPLAPTVELLILLRGLQGVAIAGLPALAMAHLSEEVEPAAVGGAMGLYVAGNTVGGLSGRLLASAVADIAGWRAGLAAVGVLALACVVAFRLLLPAPTAVPEPTAPGLVRRHLATHLRDPGVRRLCLTSFVVMSAFVTVYNFLGYRLLEPPFGLSQTLVGLVFVTYLAGTLTAPATGRLGDRVGRRGVLLGSVLLGLAAIALTLSDALVLVLLGLVLFTMGFFGAHTSASGMVGNRAQTGRSQASALYLLAYYAGSSVGGWVGGLAYEAGDWPGVVLFVGGLMLAALVLALLLRRTPPLPAPSAAAAV
ncbi:MAG: MFS transporter [Actinomycetota bacterium]|nr:MFS transporter [Actinomycetota bacterium]